MGFTSIDYVVLFAYLLATAGFGIWVGGQQRNLRDYFLAGRSLPWWAICFSIVATETSTLTFIGAPAIAYQGNLTFLQLGMGYIIGKLLVSLVLIPGYFKGEILSAYQLLRTRFGDRVQSFSALLFQINRLLADGVRLFATALVLSEVTQLSDVWTITIIGFITIIYTFFGGMAAVVWNDVVQLTLYLGGAVLAAVLLVDRIPGGWTGFLETAERGGKLQVFDLSWTLSEPYTLLAGLAGGACLTFATHGTDQMMVQRYLASKSRRDSQLALMISGVVVLFQFVLFLLIGAMLWVFYQSEPLGRELTQPNRILPIFIVDEMPPVISGLIIAAVFAAAMSTISSSLNSLSSSTVNDFYRRYVRPDGTEAHYLALSRWLTAGWGVLMILVAVLARNWGEVLQVGLTITSVVMGSVLGVFLIGRTSLRPSQNGLIAAMCVALASCIGIHLWGGLAWTWYVPIGAGITILGAALSSTTNSRAGST